MPEPTPTVVVEPTATAVPTVEPTATSVPTLEPTPDPTAVPTPATVQFVISIKYLATCPIGGDTNFLGFEPKYTTGDVESVTVHQSDGQTVSCSVDRVFLEALPQ